MKGIVATIVGFMAAFLFSGEIHGAVVGHYVATNQEFFSWFLGTWIVAGGIMFTALVLFWHE